MEARFRHHDNTSPNENKTSTTIASSLPSVTAGGEPPARAGLCGYVIAPGATPFCDRPALAGSSYCAWHRALCAVAPASPAFPALAAAQVADAERRAATPPEFGWVDAPPEAFDESDDERLAGLDLPAPAIAHDE